MAIRKNYQPTPHWKSPAQELKSLPWSRAPPRRDRCDMKREDEIFQHKPAAKVLAQNHYCFIHNSDLLNEVSVRLMQNSKAL